MFPVKVREPLGMVKITVLLRRVNASAPALFVQLPATLMVVAVPASNMPEVSNKLLDRVRVVVLPATLKVLLVLATVML